MRRPIEELQYAVEEWSADNATRLEVIARAGILSVAWSAFWAGARRATEGADRATAEGARIGEPGTEGMKRK